MIWSSLQILHSDSFNPNDGKQKTVYMFNETILRAML